MSYEQTYFDFYNKVPQSYTIDFMLDRFHSTITGENLSKKEAEDKQEELFAQGFKTFFSIRYQNLMMVSIPDMDHLDRKALLEEVLATSDFEKQKKLLLAAESFGVRAYLDDPSRAS